MPGTVFPGLDGVVALQGRAVVVSRRPGNHPPVPMGEDIVVLPPVLHEQQRPVGREVGQSVLPVRKLEADRTVGVHAGSTHTMWRYGRCRSPNGRNNAAHAIPSERFSGSSILLANRLKTRYPGLFSARDVLRGDGCRRGFSGTAVDKHLPAAETRVHHTPPDAPANTLPHQLFDDGALRVREHIRRPVENSEPEREALGIGQSVVPELNLGSVLVKRPVVLNALAVGDDDLLGDLIPGLGDERLVVRQQPAHQVVPGQPYLVLPGAAEARTFDDPQPLLQFRTGKFAADHQQNRGEFLGNPDLPVPPVQRRRFLRIPVGKPLVQQAADTPVAMPRRRRVGIKFRQGVHPRQVQRRLPPPPRPVVVVDVGPESARIEKPSRRRTSPSGRWTDV